MPAKFSLTVLFISISSFAYSDSWSHGKVDIVESYSDYILIRWNGPNTEGCSNSNNVMFDASTLGSLGALDRGFSLALATAASGQPIRCHLSGCGEGDGRKRGAQKAKGVQMCTNESCTYQ